MINRLVTQRACLERAGKLIREVPGPVLEVGLGKGRTYDHLRRLFPERAIFAFDRRVHAPPTCRPSPDRLILGDFRDTLPRALARIGAPAALIHADIGSNDGAADEELARSITPALTRLARRGAVVLADREMNTSRWRALDRPLGCGTWSYFMYQA